MVQAVIGECFMSIFFIVMRRSQARGARDIQAGRKLPHAKMERSGTKVDSRRKIHDRATVLNGHRPLNVTQLRTYFGNGQAANTQAIIVQGQKRYKRMTGQRRLQPR